MMAKAQFPRQMTIAQFEDLSPNDDACKAYTQARRWPFSAKCSRCGNEKFAAITGRAFNPQCRAWSHTGYRFSLLVGSIYENTNVGMANWFRAIHLMMTSTKGLAALAVQRVMVFGSYETARYMCVRIRAVLVVVQFRQLTTTRTSPILR